MKLFKWLIRPYLHIRYFCEKLTKTGVFGSDPAVFLKNNYTATGNLLKDGLHRFHVKQFHESSCSVASVASVVNTLKDYQNQHKINDPSQPNQKAVTQQDLLEKVRTAHWKERMSDSGHQGRRGLPLSILGRVIKDSLDAYEIKYRSIETVQATQNPKKSRACRQKLLSRLAAFEQKGNCLIIAHFDQGSFLTELHIPHISPVGGFCPQTSTVTMLDVDPAQHFPYKISFDVFYKGLSTNYNSIFRWFGYAEGGYVFIQL